MRLDYGLSARLWRQLRWLSFLWHIPEMHPRQVLESFRSSPLLAWLSLVLFALAIIVSTASPLVHPRAMQFVCSTGGVVLVQLDGQGEVVASNHGALDCPLCLPAGPPPLRFSSRFVPPEPRALALRPTRAAHLAALVGAPLPPRGPPRA